LTWILRVLGIALGTAGIKPGYSRRRRKAVTAGLAALRSLKKPAFEESPRKPQVLP
jgi:hypothetical protein